MKNVNLPDFSDSGSREFLYQSSDVHCYLLVSEYQGSPSRRSPSY